MKKAVHTAPKQRLKEERELRGWSQKYVAEQIGADHYYLSRWERGSASPSPYYRQRLCALFGKNARELGLLPEEDDTGQKTSAAEAEQERKPAPPAGILDPVIPLLSAGLTSLIGRDEMLDQLKQRLCAGKDLVLTALNGLPGVGKTALAVALAHDHDVLDYFHDGVLWAALGPRPNIPVLLSRWGDLLGISAADATTLTSIEAWTAAIRAAIGTRQLLLVIDDAWEIEEALAFKVGGPHCAYLVTTRFPYLAVQFATDGATMIHELNEHDSFILLERLAPDVVRSEPEALQGLVQAVGGLPLALALIGKYLRTQSYSGQTRRIRAAIERLRDAEERLSLSEPQALLERSPTLARNTPVSLQTIIAVSDQQLEEQERSALRDLSVFPAKPNSFSEEAALAVCDSSAETLDALSDAGLLESRGPGRYALHQTIADYARAQLADPGAFARMTAYFAGYVEANAKDYEALEPETANIFAALEVAFARGLYMDLLRMVNAFFRFLDARGLYAQAEVHLKRAEEASRSAQDGVGLVVVLLNLGNIAERRGDYVRAEALLQEGLVLARQRGDGEQTGHLLMNLGVVATHRGDYMQAEKYGWEGLALARQQGDPEQISGVLQGLGTVADRQGNHIQAETYWQEALSLARQIEYRDRVSLLLSNLGWLTMQRGNYAQAETYLQEGLVVARQVGHRDHMSLLLLNLGNLAEKQGSYAEAKASYEEGLAAARQIGHRDRTCRLLAGLGWVMMEQGNYPQAEAYLREGLDVARHIGHRDQLSLLLLNLGLALGEQGNYAQAETYLQEGLDVARQVGYRDRVSMLLMALGWAAGEHGRYVQAEEHFQEALAIARQAGNREQAGYLLFDLGWVSHEQGNYPQSETYLQEALDIARQLDNPRLISVALNEWGKLHLKLAQFDAASAAFREVEAKASSNGNQALIAGAFYGLAQVALAQGNLIEARRQGLDSLAIFEKIGHRMASEVKQWLEVLPRGKQG